METPDPRLAALGARIRKFRQEQGWTRLAAAKAAGISPRFFSQLENGQGNISVRRLMDVADSLKVELGAISHAAMDYQDEFDKILKSGKTMKEVFGGIHETISELTR